MYRATYYVTYFVEVPVSGETFAEALETAKKKPIHKIVKLLPGVDNLDCQIQLAGVNDSTVNGEM